MVARALVSAFLWLILGVAQVAVAHAEPPALRVIVPRPESAQDVREQYPIALLRLALDRSGRSYRLVVSPTLATQARNMRRVATGQDLDVVWTVTSKERESELRAVRIPIDRGLMGWRTLVIRRDDMARFARIRSLPELSKLLAGQGHDWPDLAILRANGLRAYGAPNYESLFTMLARGHLDYLPRGIGESGAELARRPELGLIDEPGILLHYPSAMYYFVNRNNGELATAIEAGLRKSLADGSFDRLFDANYGAASNTIKQGQRRVFELANPDLPAAALASGSTERRR